MDEITSQQDLIKAFKHDKPIIIKFYLDDCAPCKTIGKFYEQLRHKYGNTIFMKCKYTNKLSKELNIKKIPTFVSIVDEDIKEIIQTSNKEELENFINKNTEQDIIFEECDF